ncbi:hypothetical protein BLOT_005848 [Blomia tropicalis]|nr:hypothetical protein BLOT_005848 [Blomia tropicalis]
MNGGERLNHARTYVLILKERIMCICVARSSALIPINKRSQSIEVKRQRLKVNHIYVPYNGPAQSILFYSALQSPDANLN